MTDHILKNRADASRYFANLTGLFSLFLAAAGLSGIAILILKTDGSALRLAEAYKGSEAMIAVFPDYRDSFMNPKSLYGLLKLTSAHFIAYSFAVFYTAHLLRSLVSEQKRRAVDRFNSVFFLTALADLILPFLLLYGPWWVSYIKMPVSFIFYGMILISSGAIFILAVFSSAGAASAE